MKVRDFSKLYFAFLILHLAVIYKQDFGALFYISKPLLMVSLLIFFISKTEGAKRGKSLVAGAILFSLFGDVLLMRSEENLFLYGMISFAIAQISYSLYFFGRALPAFKITTALIALPLLLGAFYFLNNHIDIPPDMVVPINIYGVLLGFTLISGINFALIKKSPVYFIPLGVIVFLISDLLLAYNKFGPAESGLQIMVMLTYGFAQFLIIAGVLWYMDKDNVERTSATS